MGETETTHREHGGKNRKGSCNIVPGRWGKEERKPGKIRYQVTGSKMRAESWAPRVARWREATVWPKQGCYNLMADWRGERGAMMWMWFLSQMSMCWQLGPQCNILRGGEDFKMWLSHEEGLMPFTRTGWEWMRSHFCKNGWGCARMACYKERPSHMLGPFYMQPFLLFLHELNTCGSHQKPSRCQWPTVGPQELWAK